MSKPAPKMMEVDLSESERRRLKVAAVRAGVAQKTLVGDIIRRWLKGAK